MTIPGAPTETEVGAVWRVVTKNAANSSADFVSVSPCLFYDEPCTIQHWQLRDLLHVPSYPFGTGRFVYFVSEGSLRRLDLKYWHTLAQEGETASVRAAALPAGARVASRVRDALESLARERYLFLLRRELRERQRRADAGETARANLPEFHDASHLWDDADDNDVSSAYLPVPTRTATAGRIPSDRRDRSPRRSTAGANSEPDASVLPLFMPLTGAEAATMLAGSQIDELLRLELEQSARMLTQLIREAPSADTRIRLVRVGGTGPVSVHDRESGVNNYRTVPARSRSRRSADPRQAMDPRPRLEPSGRTTALLNQDSWQRSSRQLETSTHPSALRRPPSASMPTEREMSPAPTDKRYRSQRLQKYSFWPTSLCVMEPYVAVGGQGGQLVVGHLNHTASEGIQADHDGSPEAYPQEGENLTDDDDDDDSYLNRRVERTPAHITRELEGSYRWGYQQYDLAVEQSGFWGPHLGRTAEVTDSVHCTTLLCGELRAGVVNNALTMAPTPADAARTQSWYLEATSWDAPTTAWSGALPRYLLVSTNDESVKIFDLERVREGHVASITNDAHSASSGLPSSTLASQRRARTLEPDQVIRCSTNINYTAVSPDAKRLLAVGDSAEVFLFDSLSPSTGGGFRLHTTLREALDAGISAAWHPSGRQFAVASQDGTCCVWDTRFLNKPLVRYYTQSLFPIRSACRSVKFSPAEADVDLLVFAEHQKYVHIACARTYGDQVQTINLSSAGRSDEASRRGSPWQEQEEHIAGLGFARHGSSLMVGTESGIREYHVHHRQRHQLGDFIW
jgi:WD40 repeat protein